MKKLLIVTFVLFLAMIAMSACGHMCADDNTKTDPIPSDYAAQAKTIGNNTWINLAGISSNNWMRFNEAFTLTLEIKRSFEDTHPELEVISWETIQSMADYRTIRLVGLVAHHRPKTAAELEAPPQ